MDDRLQQERPMVGALLALLRKKKRFSKQALADASGVSATYISLIEGGFDPNTGRPVAPSAKVIRALAKALADGDAGEESQIYEGMMAAAGYIEAPSAAFLPAEIATPPTAEKPRSLNNNHDTVTLRDPRLWAHCRAVLESWEELAPDDQAAVLAFLKLVYEKHRLQNGSPKAG